MSHNTLEAMYSIKHFPKKFDEVVYTFDLDKTYLATEFETLSGLVRIPFEGPEDKRNIPGAAALVRELRRGTNENYRNPLYFISGSPRQLENVIKEKFRLDGVTFDGILFKDFTSAIKKLKFKQIINKIGFKLSALLYGRSVFPHRADEILFGDDSEYDATIYSVYSDIISGKLEYYELQSILKTWKVDLEERRTIEKNYDLLQKSKWEPRDAVRRIFINLETGSSPNDYHTLTDKVIPTNNYFQAAVILYYDNEITKPGLFRVISELIRVYNFQIIHFLETTEDLLRRQLIDRKQAKKLAKIVSKRNPLSLPIQFVNEISVEFSALLSNFKKIQNTLIPTPKRREKSVIESYLNHVPNRRV